MPRLPQEAAHRVLCSAAMRQLSATKKQPGESHTGCCTPLCALGKGRRARRSTAPRTITYCVAVCGVRYAVCGMRCVMRYAVCFDRVLLKAERALARLKVRLRACRIRVPHSSGMASRLPTGARHSDGGLTMTFPSLPAPCQKRSRTRPGREGRLITQTWPGIPDRVWCALP